jgi:hypothetical protein
MADNLPSSSVDVMESGRLNLPEPFRPHRLVMGLLYLSPNASKWQMGFYWALSFMGANAMEGITCTCLCYLTARGSKIYRLRAGN